MKANNQPRFNTNRLIALLLIVFGLMLLVYMITVESEPGALPLLMIITGGGWYGYHWHTHRTKGDKP